MFGNNDVSQTSRVGLLLDIVHLAPFILVVIHFVSINKDNDIGILLNAAAFPQVGKLRYMRGTPFHSTAELRYR